MDKKIYDAYLRILHEELIPALGCTEPIAIALAGAKAREVLGVMPRRLTARCSSNVIKNAMGVIVPTTGNLKGVDTSAVLGALAGSAQKGLEVLADVQPEDIEKTRHLLEQGVCTVELLDTPHPLHIIMIAEHGDDRAEVEIRDAHTNIVRITRNGETVHQQQEQAADRDDGADDRKLLTLDGVLEFADSVDLEDVEELLQRQIDYNLRIAQEGLENSYGANVGSTLVKRGIEDIRTYARALAAAGSDARMGGCVLPVVINSGSGNQGMTASLPVIAYAEHLNAGREKMLRALVVSNLSSLLQKKEIGRLSAYCGVVCAACGSGAAITWLHGGGRKAIADTITNALANISGIVCDGAKASCAAKIATSVDAAILAHDMAMGGNTFPSGEGIVKADIQDTIESVGRLARDGMRETDREIIRIMLD